MSEYSDLIEELKTYNERTKNATESYETNLVSIGDAVNTVATDKAAVEAAIALIPEYIQVPDEATAITLSAANPDNFYYVLDTQSGGDLGDITSDYDSVVFIGASIMNGLAGTNNTEHVAATAALNVQGIKVYGNGHPSQQISNLIAQAQASVSAFPTRTLFIVHAGGNNLSLVGSTAGGDKGDWDLATAQERQEAIDDYTALVAVFAGRENDVIFSPLTMRDYDQKGFVANTVSDSKKFSDEVIRPHYTSRFQNTDGYPIIDLYGMVINNSWWLSSDGVHMLDSHEHFRSHVMDRVRELLTGGNTTPYPHNIPSNPVITPNAFSVGLGYFALNSNLIRGEDFNSGTGAVTVLSDDRNTSMTIQCSETGNVTPFINGFMYGNKSFDWTLDSDPSYLSSCYVSLGEKMHFEMAGLTANTSYTLSFIGYAEGSSRKANIYDANQPANAVILDRVAKGVDSHVDLIVTTDGTGTINITVEPDTSSGSTIAFLGAMRIVLT